MTSIPSILKYLSDSSNFNVVDQNIEAPARAKKRRLDHLSWEEKLQRKKLKNRVAAQTSRDRKKAKMDQLEKAVEDLFLKNKSLLDECDNLKELNSRLTEENAELHKRLTSPCANCSQSRTVECETQSGSAESLLRPQGTVTHSAASLTQQTTTALLKIVLACLLYRTSLTSSTATSTFPLSSSSRRAFFKISPETWRLLLKKQIYKNQILVKKNMDRWWGRHQKSWNPMEVTA